MSKILRAAAVAAPVAFAALSGVLADEAWEKLVTPAALADLERVEPDLRIVDIRAAAADQGKPSYAAGHIPGAVSAPYGSWRGPKDNPGLVLDDAALTERLQSLGIEADTPVVVAHQGANPTDFGAAARVYWTLKSAGLSRIAILNGGVAAWAGAGLPLSTEPVTPARSSIIATLSTEWLAGREEIAAITAGDRSAVLLDARPADFYEGRAKHPLAFRAGTLDGAVNLTHSSWFAGDAPDFRSSEDALTRLTALSGGAGDAPVVSFCNTGHWAATNWFAASEIAGIEGVKLYPESMVGWGAAGGALVNGN